MLFDLARSQKKIRWFTQADLSPDIEIWVHDAFADKYLMPIHIQNVREYVDIQHDNKKVTWDWLTDFPNIAPPFELMWMEYKFENVGKTGFLIHSEKTDDGWSMVIFNFQQIESDAPLVSVTNALINKDGSIRQRSNGGWVRNIFPEMPDPKHIEILRSGLQNALIPVFLSICFMNCKNISLDKSPEWPEKLQKSRIRKGKLPLIRHHTIIIDGIKKIIKEAQNGNDGISPKALHICRGHFKNFDEHPLFGKYRGTYWWPQQMRGSKAFGEITKDYKINAVVGG
jgi:hypothetical protein